MEATEETIKEKKEKRMHNFLVRWILIAILISLIVLNTAFITIANNIANMHATVASMQTTVEKVDFLDNILPFKKHK